MTLLKRIGNLARPVVASALLAAGSFGGIGTARAGSYGLQIGIWNRIIADDGTEISASPIIHWMNGYKPERKEAGR